MGKQIKRIILNLVNLFNPKLEYFVFESVPDFDGSSWMVSQELRRKGYDKKYKFVWMTTTGNIERKKNFLCIPYDGKSIKERVYKYYVISKAALIVDSNHYVYKKNAKTIRIFAGHGGLLKRCDSYLRNMGSVDYILNLSGALADIYYEIVRTWNLISSKDKMINTGLPSNDRLFEPCDLYAEGFWTKLLDRSIEKKFDKIIGWLPTFRQHRSGDASVCVGSVFPFGVPLLKTQADLLCLNELLKKKNVLLVIQMHHAQMQCFPRIALSNIALISQKLKDSLNISTANLMHNFDALITDYSAAYHEFLLLDRPIALSVDDYEEYKLKIGFYYDYRDFIRGVYLNDVQSLLRFIDEITDGVDSARDARHISMHKIHDHIDNKSTERVVNLIATKVGL